MLFANKRASSIKVVTAVFSKVVVGRAGKLPSSSLEKGKQMYGFKSPAREP